MDFMKNYQNSGYIKNEVENTIHKLISYLEKHNFQGWEPYDIPEFKSINFLLPSTVRAFLTQVFRLSPIFLHPYFIEKKLHAKAATLFAQAFLILLELTNDKKYYDRAVYFLDWIKKHRSSQSIHFSIGTQYQLNMKNYHAHPGTPAPLITCFAIEAFMSAHEILGDNSFLELAESGIFYFLNELPQIRISNNLSYFIYHPSNTQFIPNLPAVISGMLSRFYSIKKNQELLHIISNNLNYVIKFQREDGSWFYQPELRYADSFHTAFILEALAKFQYYTGDNSYETNFLNGLSYYEKTFFKPGMHPIHKKLSGLSKNADSLLTNIDLRDIAMGIVLFSFLTLNKKYPLNRGLNLLNWCINHFKSYQGFFYYQKIPFYTIKGPFLSMQAWILYALCKLLKTLKIYETKKLSSSHEKKTIQLF